MLKLKLPGLAVLAVVSMLAAGCGDDEGGSGGDALSKEEFTKQANAACKKFDEEGEKLGDPQSVDEIPAYADKALALFDKQLAELRDIKPPEELQDDYDEFLSQGDDAKQFISDLKSAAESKDEEEIKKIAEEADARDQKSDETATKLGLTECAND
jgi:hypothetical protein